jgi:hypothetical protein
MAITELPPRFASPVQTVNDAYLAFARYSIATPVCGDGNAILRATPALLARMVGAPDD